MLYDAKVYLELDALFAWTLTIVLASRGFEWCDRESESCRLRRDEGFVVRSDDGEGLTEMNKLLERVGNLSEKYSSKWIDWLPDFSLLVALKWIMLVLILGTAALAGWYGAAAIRGLFL